MTLEQNNNRRLSTLAAAIDRHAKRLENSPWIPASGGTEKPFKTRSGRTVQYLWQPATGDHRYIDTETDLFLTDDEVSRELG